MVGMCRSCEQLIEDDADYAAIARTENGVSGLYFFYHLSCYFVLEEEFQAMQDDILEVIGI